MQECMGGSHTSPGSPLAELCDSSAGTRLSHHGLQKSHSLGAAVHIPSKGLLLPMCNPMLHQATALAVTPKENWP